MWHSISYQELNLLVPERSDTRVTSAPKHMEWHPATQPTRFPVPQQTRLSSIPLHCPCFSSCPKGSQTQWGNEKPDKSRSIQKIYRSGHQLHLFHLLPLRPWITIIRSLCLSFLICKIRLSTLMMCCKDKWNNACNMTWHSTQHIVGEQ